MTQDMKQAYLENLRESFAPGVQVLSAIARGCLPETNGLEVVLRGMEEMLMPGRWEFMLIDATEWEFGEMHARLAELQQDGWELVSPAQPRLGPGADGGELKFVLRRRVAQPPAAGEVRSA